VSAVVIQRARNGLIVQQIGSTPISGNPADMAVFSDGDTAKAVAYVVEWLSTPPVPTAAALQQVSEILKEE
jgi:hypothetical protein